MQESNNIFDILASIHKDTKYTSNLQIYPPFFPRLQTVTHPVASQLEMAKLTKLQR